MELRKILKTIIIFVAMLGVWSMASYTDAVEYENRMLRIVNQERTKNKLSSLKLIEGLTKTSDDLLREKIKSIDLKSEEIFLLLQKNGIQNCKKVFVNIATGYKTPEEAQKSWMDDNKQKINLLNSEMTHMGLSCIYVGDVRYWCIILINKLDDIDKSTLDNYKLQVISLVNAERQKEGLKPLTGLTSMMEASQIRAVEQVKKEGHTRPNGSDCFSVINDIGLKLEGNYCLGENVAYGQRTPQEVVDAWMKSSGHRANILNKDYNYIGVGAHYEGGVVYWAQMFLMK